MATQKYKRPDGEMADIKVRPLLKQLREKRAAEAAAASGDSSKTWERPLSTKKPAAEEGSSPPQS